MGSPPGATRQVPRRTFEALFRDDGVPPTGPMKDELRAIGLDLDALQPSYPLPILRLAFEVARRHAFPALPEAEGFRSVGRAFVRGFKQTPIGWVFRSMAPVFGPERTIQTLPRYVGSVREDLPMEIIAVGERRYQLSSPDGGANPHFLAGCLDAVLETCGAKGGVVEVITTTADGFSLDIRWG
ncbi:MAG: DUF2378 family protein [Myxococcota bacterium]|jgi:uncharacterized protein (TIGR02265 family)